MKQTEHLKLRKPDQEDYYEIDDHNYNSDLLDDSISGLQADVEGKAAEKHSHSAADITTGTVESARLPAASTTAAGIVQLHDTLTSTSTDQALTAAQGKALQDAVSQKAPASVMIIPASRVMPPVRPSCKQPAQLTVWNLTAQRILRFLRMALCTREL